MNTRPGIDELSTPDGAQEPRYGRFLVMYPSGTTFESYYLIGGGGTVQQVRLEHPLAVVEAIEASQVPVEATP